MAGTSIATQSSEQRGNMLAKIGNLRSRTRKSLDNRRLLWSRRGFPPQGVHRSDDDDGEENDHAAWDLLRSDSLPLKHERFPACHELRFVHSVLGEWSSEVPSLSSIRDSMSPVRRIFLILLALTGPRIGASTPRIAGATWIRIGHSGFQRGCQDHPTSAGTSTPIFFDP